MKVNKMLAACAVVMLSLLSFAAYAQNRASGTVVDAQGNAVPGASVVVKGTTTGTMTDAQGYFAIQAPAGATLDITCLGYASQSVPAGPNLRIVLAEDNEFLDEVVVVGYGTQKRANLTGAVSTVDVQKTLEAKSVANLGKALQGAVPGLTVTQNRGKIGDEPDIVIRGIGTLSNSGTTKPLYIVDGVPIDNISYLNTQDIESISVLKDAASASIYGTRAAFGVVLITTKSAHTTEKAVVSYTNNFGWSQATVLPDYPTVREQVNGLIEANNRAGVQNELFGMLMDTPEFLAGVDAWQAKHGGKSGYREMVEGDDYIKGVGYFADWDVAGIMFNNAAPSQNHTVSVQGTSGRTNYYLSLGFDREEGLMTFNPDVLRKYTALVNVSSQVTDWLQVGARVNYVNRDYRDPSDALRQGTYQYMWRWGSFFGPWGTINGLDGKNAIAYRKQAGENYDKRDNLRLGAFIKADILKGLTLNADYTYLMNFMRYKQTNLPVYGMNTWGVNPSEGYFVATSYIQLEDDHRLGYNTNIYLNYEFDVAKNNHFNIMAGFNADYSEYEYRKNSNDNILDYNLPEFALTEKYKNFAHAHNYISSAGFFGRINYDYKGRYLVELNGRYDGSSKFPSNHRWAFFPSASIGWRVSEEPFFAPIKETVNNLKVRASYGEVGNQEVGSNMFLATMTRQGSDVKWLGAGATKFDTFSAPALVSADLTWEAIATTNIGVDLGLLKGDLNVYFDWFQRKNRSMLAPGQTMPKVLGTSAAYENAGSLRSRGWEVTVDWHHTFRNGLNLYAIANLSDYKTVVTEWDNDAQLLNTNYSGKVYGDIYGFETDRYFTRDDFTEVGGKLVPKEGVASQVGLESGSFVFGPGDIKFVDQNGDGVIDAGKGSADDHGDLIVIGNTTPRYQYSFRIGGSWKGFDVDMFFQGVGKRSMWTQSAFVMPLMRGVDAIYSNQTDYVTTEEALTGTIDQDHTYPRLFGGGAGQGNISSHVISAGRYNFYPQSRYLVNMAYLRLKNITVGYTLPSKWTEKVHLEKVRVYGSINNAFDIINHTKKNGLDPEINTGEGNYGNGVWGRTDPILRTYSCGIQVTFGGILSPVKAPVVAPEIREVVREIIKEKVVEKPVEKVIEKVVEKPVSTLKGEYSDDLYFVIGKAEIRPDEAFKLGEICRVLKDNPEAKVAITGYADSATGNAKVNKSLSAARADVVAKMLIANGIAADRIVADSTGSDKDASASPESNRVAVCIVK